jgi:hypothetical protein
MATNLTPLSRIAESGREPVPLPGLARARRERLKRDAQLSPEAAARARADLAEIESTPRRHDLPPEPEAPARRREPAPVQNTPQDTYASRVAAEAGAIVRAAAEAHAAPSPTLHFSDTPEGAKPG